MRSGRVTRTHTALHPYTRCGRAGEQNCIGLISLLQTSRQRSGVAVGKNSKYPRLVRCKRSLHSPLSPDLRAASTATSSLSLTSPGARCRCALGRGAWRSLEGGSLSTIAHADARGGCRTPLAGVACPVSRLGRSFFHSRVSSVESRRHFRNSYGFAFAHASGHASPKPPSSSPRVSLHRSMRTNRMVILRGAIGQGQNPLLCKATVPRQVVHRHSILLQASS